ncbi:MAG: YdeI/OmpD-associated family protein [Bacteroidota bacterium]
MPEVLEALLAQDKELNSKFEKLTDGKKRSLIYYTTSVKDLDQQVQKAMAFLNG